ncbi:MAG: hypothetical protein JWM31_2762, partial [Solirubrobacterales bacterium]|nr:hypothetical protein [Solirubrobacterales bacterium]
MSTEATQPMTFRPLQAVLVVVALMAAVLVPVPLLFVIGYQFWRLLRERPRRSRMLFAWTVLMA